MVSEIYNRVSIYLVFENSLDYFLPLIICLPICVYQRAIVLPCPAKYSLCFSSDESIGSGSRGARGAMAPLKFQNSIGIQFCNRKSLDFSQVAPLTFSSFLHQWMRVCLAIIVYSHLVDSLTVFLVALFYYHKLTILLKLVTKLNFFL